MGSVRLKIIAVIVAILVLVLTYFVGKNNGYDNGYKTGYDVGYANALESVTPVEKPKNDTVQVATAVKTETQTTVRPKTQQEITHNTPAVQITTKEPTVQATVNGKKYEFKPQSQILETGIATTATINVKIPERRWVAGVGYGKDKKVSYMLKAPIGKSAVGVWLAGQDKHNVMGGISISF